MGSVRDEPLLGAALSLAVVVGCAPPDPQQGEGTSGSTEAPAEGTTRSEAGLDTGSTTAASDSTDDGTCPPYGLPCPEPAVCEQLGVPICGDALVQALEECDGSPGCRECRDASEPTPWIAVDDTNLEVLVPLADGGVMTLESGIGPIVRYDADGIAAWSLTTEERSVDLAVDALGNAYAVGYAGDLPWAASWDGTGALRWSTLGTALGRHALVEIDAARLVAAGTTEQQNSPLPRGSLAQYDHDGALQWSAKISSIEEVVSIALVGDEVAVLGKGLDWSRHLLRVDAQGAVRWSLDVTHSSGVAHGVVSDGADGTWIYGRREEGPWLQRHDRDGALLAELVCLGATAGSVSRMVVDPRGRLVLAIQLSDVVLPIDRNTPWLAWVDGGTITAGAWLGNADGTIFPFGLALWPDGRLAVGLQELAPSVARVMVVEP